MTQTKTAAALIISLLLAIFALGCGGDSGGEGSASSSAGGIPDTAPAQGKGDQIPASDAEASKPGARQGNRQQVAKDSSEKPSGAAAFKTPGADNSIQEFGNEASSAELARAAAVLHAYLEARAEGEWKVACDQLAPGLTKSLGALGAAAQKGGSAPAPSCPKLLAGLSAGIAPSTLRESALAEVGALRTQGAQGFLLFHGAHDSDYFMPMAREGDVWKVAAIAPSPLS